MSDSPWQEISVDLLEISSGNRLLVVVNYYSRWIKDVLLKKTDAQHVIKYMEAIFRTHGLPETVRSDNGPPFASMEFDGFLAIEHKKGVPYWPQSNGEVERCNETLLKIVRIARMNEDITICLGAEHLWISFSSTELLLILLLGYHLRNC